MKPNILTLTQIKYGYYFQCTLLYLKFIHQGHIFVERGLHMFKKHKFFELCVDNWNICKPLYLLYRAFFLT